MATAALIAHMRAQRPMALLAEIDHPDGAVYVWSRVGTLTYDGHEWTGLGVLGRVRPVGTSRKTAIQQVTFELRGVPATATQFLSSNVRGRSGNLWMAGILPGRKVVADPVLISSVLFDYQTLAVEDDGTATIALIGYTGLWVLDRAQDKAWTPEEIRLTYPDETGLDLIAGLTSKDVQWRPS